MKTFGAKVVSAVNVSNKGWREVGWYTILTGLGAGLTYLAGHIGEIDMQKLGEYGPLVMTIAMPVIAYLKNKIQEAMKGKEDKPEPDKPTPPIPPFHRELDFNLIKQK